MGMARYQCLQRYPAHRLLADVGLLQSACERAPFTPNDDVRRCNSFRNSAHIHLSVST